MDAEAWVSAFGIIASIVFSVFAFRSARAANAKADSANAIAAASNTIADNAYVVANAAAPPLQKLVYLTEDALECTRKNFPRDEAALRTSEYPSFEALARLTSEAPKIARLVSDVKMRENLGEVPNYTSVLDTTLTSAVQAVHPTQDGEAGPNATDIVDTIAKYTDVLGQYEDLLVKMADRATVISDSR